MVTKGEKYVWLFVSVLIFTVGCLPHNTLAQGTSPKLKLSILNTEKQLSSTSILRFHIENQSKRAVTIRQIILTSRSVQEISKNCSDARCFFAHVQLGKTTIAKGRSVEVEARLDDRHWFYSRSQTFMYRPQLPNFHERFKQGNYQLIASVSLPIEVSPYHEVFQSDEAIVHVEEQ